MREKPELLISAASVEEIERYVKAGADAVEFGEARFGTRLPGDVPENRLADAVNAAHVQGAKAYVSVNNLFENEALDDLRSYLGAAHAAGADAFIFGDPAVLMLLREEGIKAKLHWNAEMTGTNYGSANYWQRHGASRAILARELNLEEIREFAGNTTMEVQIQIHGLTTIYHSKRRLVQSYMEHIGRESEDSGMGAGLYLVEHERRNLRLPIYEDPNGTHILSAEDICLIDVLDEVLEVRIDSVKIDGLLKSAEHNEALVRLYRKALDRWHHDPEAYECDPAWLDEIEAMQTPGRDLTYGFLFKEQVY